MRAALTSSNSPDGRTLRRFKAMRRVQEAARDHDAALASDSEIADLVGKSVQWVSNYRRIQGLHPELLQSMDFPAEGERKLPMKIALLLAPLKPFDQLGQWDKVKAMPTSEGFHKLRTSGKVRHIAKRSPSDDADYAEGKAANALQQVEAIVKLPMPMLKGLSLETLVTIGKLLAKISAQVDLAQERMLAAAEDAKKKAA